jgi:hypothetical protein
MSEALKEQLARLTASSSGEQMTAVLDTIAHDLRNSVATIRMECAVLGVEENPEKIKAIAANLERAADGVAEMVSMMEDVVEKHDAAGEGTA